MAVEDLSALAAEAEEGLLLSVSLCFEMEMSCSLLWAMPGMLCFLHVFFVVFGGGSAIWWWLLEG